MAPFDPLVDSTCSVRLMHQRDNCSDGWPGPDAAKEEPPLPWLNPHQRRPSRVKNKTPLKVRAEKRHRKNKAAKLHRKTIAIAVATKRNRERRPKG